MEIGSITTEIYASNDKTRAIIEDLRKREPTATMSLNQPHK
jgi:hypothetical protein